MESIPDSALIERILNNEAALFEHLIRRNNPYLYRIGKMYRFSHEDTQDLMQDTYLDAFVHLAQFQNRSTFKTWISKIMLNKCYHQTKKWQTNSLESLEKNQLVLESANNAETLSKVMNKELKSVIENSLLNIPVDYRVAFTLREINGLSVHETADVLEISESNVKIRLHRAKSMLRTEIKKFYRSEEIFEFNLIYCDQMVLETMMKIRKMIG